MKKYIHILFIYFLLAGIQSASAQVYYPIPDANLRNALISNYPTYMNANGELDVTAAKLMSADLVLDNAQIENADGIQFFESTGILKMRNNKLTSIPQLSTMYSLRRIYINGNMITSIPNISALYQLIDLFIGNNKITSIVGLETLTTLQYFNFAGNNITTIPDLSALINLKTLSVGFNPVSAIPDLSKNVLLQQLDVSNSNISSVPSLPALANLETFVCDRSNITDLSLLNSNTKLIKLVALNCKLTALPNFSNKPNLTSVNISNNYLTFEDLIPLTTLPTFSAFTYAPQKDLTIPSYVDMRESNNYTYQISIDLALNTNQYTWLKNSIPLFTNPTGDYSFTPLFMSDSGVYVVEVTNPSLPALVLKSNNSKLIVRTCIEIDNVNLLIRSSDCREGALIDIAGTIVNGATTPITYILQTTTDPAKDIYGVSATQFSNIIPGVYVLQATDSKNCVATKSFILDKRMDCESAFSPNGDGVMDTYFIAESGTAQIYNTAKKLIKTLTIPAVWDGTTNDGGLANAGYYVIIINGSTVTGISLMR